MKYDYLVVGAGLFGATFAQQAAEKGKRVLVVDRRTHIAGNAHTYLQDGIHVHRYGAHIFHTNNPTVWEYLNRFSAFTPFVHSPVAFYRGETYSLPFNMHTFRKLWGTETAQEAQEIIRQQSQAAPEVPQNLEEQAIALVGTDIYETLVKGYTEKQWGRPCRELPPSIIRRLPVRFTYDSNYFNAAYQGIPVGGYTAMVENMLRGIEVRLGVDYLQQKETLDQLAETVLYTGAIDAYYGYCYGALEYRSLRFETEVLDGTYQGCAVVNYTDAAVPYTRIIEHKYFQPASQERTVITREYSCAWGPGAEPYYPVNDEKNTRLYTRYRQLAENEKNVLFGGRLGLYAYYDMDTVVEKALTLADTVLR